MAKSLGESVGKTKTRDTRENERLLSRVTEEGDSLDCFA